MSLNHQTKLIECDSYPCPTNSTLNIFSNEGGQWTWFNVGFASKDVCPNCKSILIEIYGDRWKEFIKWK